MAPSAYANPSLTADFGRMSAWLSHELAQGLAFNAGSTFDPPHEVISHRLQPDLSVGVGHMPLDKKKFPNLETTDIQNMAATIFPSAILFPNLAMHLRSGLPGRMDMSIRLANMTTPPGYRVSPTATGSGQSNSLGFGLRKHLFGGPDQPLLSLGANYNHVYGRFSLNSKSTVETNGLSLDSPIKGELGWNVSSLGFNAVLSHAYRGWTPFVGLGYNYAVGSVRVRLESLSTTLTNNISAEASEHPEQNQGRVILGLEMTRPWMHFFANGEVQTIGTHAWDAWVVHVGAALPFEISWRGITHTKIRAEEVALRSAEYDYAESDDLPRPAKKSQPRKIKPATADMKSGQGLIFVQ